MLTPYIKLPKPKFDYNRPLSWSALSSFKWSKEKWYQHYILDIKEPASKEMLFGNYIGGKLSSDPLFMPEVERASIFEQKLVSKIDDINLLGFLDSFCPDKKILLEYKTSRNKKRWTHKTVKEHGQLDFYAFLIYQNYKIKPEDLMIKLIYIPCCIKDGESCLSGESPKTFTIKKTTADVLKFANHIKEIRKQMLDYYNNK